MGRRITYTLTKEQLTTLEEAITYSPYPEVRQRAIAIRLLHLGQSPEQAALAAMVKAAAKVQTVSVNDTRKQ
jgi:hypothetical protein